MYSHMAAEFQDHNNFLLVGIARINSKSAPVLRAREDDPILSRVANVNLPQSNTDISLTVQHLAPSTPFSG